MQQSPTLWHVTVTVAGEPQPAAVIHDALERLLSQWPFIHSLRYDQDRAEISYWEEGEEMVDAASLALRLWNEHRISAELPAWKVLGLEVVERETFLGRESSTPMSQLHSSPRRF